VELCGGVLDRVPGDWVAAQALTETEGVLRLSLHSAYSSTVNALVACFGNVLRGDDGVGHAVAERLLAEPLPDGVRVLDVGIGGIHLVQELFTGIDILIVVDAVDLGRSPGTVLVQRPEVLDAFTLTADRRRDELADMHLATPAKALMMARGLGVLPPTTLVVGVQTTDTCRLGQGLSDPTAGAVPAAVTEVRRLLAHHGQTAE